MSIVFTNSLTRKKEEFISIRNGEVSLYTCGPTVYNYPHIGNLRTFLFEDLLHRWLSYRGYKVRHVMNLTDVDDKTIKNSIQRKMTLKEYTDIYKKAFFEDLKALNFTPAEQYPAATDYIDGMIEMIQTLEKQGHAYTTDDGVYFKVASFPEYGKLAHIDQSSLKAGASGRMTSDEYSKEELSDFALWKKWSPEDGDVKWDSPYGAGRPGWHIECSVMCTKILGETIDIHCGGIDNMFPHHENEIAQSEAASGKKFVNYWMHAIHLVVDGEKMSKSKGNFYTLRDLLDKGYSARAIRYALLTTHYRKPLNFTFDLIKQAESSLKRIDDFLFTLKNISRSGPKDAELSKSLESSGRKFGEALDDDLNISEGLSALFELINVFYEKQADITVELADEAGKLLLEFDRTLGFIETRKAEDLSDEEKLLLEERTKAKQARDFKRADEIRDKLLEKKIEVRDTKDGLVWKRLS